MKILNVAEKPSVARSISKVLSTHCRTARGRHKYCPNISFEVSETSGSKEMIFTSVLGHLYEYDFAEHGGWAGIDPCTLFDTEIIRRLGKGMEEVADNIRSQARGCREVVIWTDCDREGENIAMQIKGLVGGAIVRRARFSGISRSEIERALENLVEINKAEAAAVDARIELDLRIGAAFTRFQTLAIGSACSSERRVLSFGPCQIPTLNFVVQRHKAIVDFVSEEFYSLENKVTIGGLSNVFRWKRQRIFDRNFVLFFYQLLRNGQAIILEKKTENKERWRPLLLRTVEFQKVCSSYCRMSGHALMGIAERLYNNGFISYPRTETDSFSNDFNYRSIVHKLEKDGVVGTYASGMRIVAPRKGKNNDQAHSPIYPLKDGEGLSGDERRVYEFVARRFLACVSENAKGVETIYTMGIRYKNGAAVEREELFECKGLCVLEKNYLEIYIYEKWESTAIGTFAEGEMVPNNLTVETGGTTAPEYLTESDLISLMDKHGIGTDATIHEHIQKIQTREYVRKEKQRFKPTELGLCLIEAYSQLDLNVSEPTLRKNLEENLRLVCLGQKNKQELVQEEVALYKRIYRKLADGSELFKRIIGNSGAGSGGKGGGTGSGIALEPKRESRQTLTQKTGPSSKKKSAVSIKNDENIVNTTAVKKAENPLCNCGKEAKAFTAKKGANSGKQFFCCSLIPRRCDFFQWEGGELPTKRRKIDNQQIADIKCDCGYDPARKTAHTEANSGREFYCCNKSYKKCKFFKWADEIS